MLLAVASSGQSISAPNAPKLPQESHRIIVKLGASFAGQVEAELASHGSLSAMAISAGQARSAAVQGFFAKYSPDRMTPLYPAMIRARQQHGWSDVQIAGLSRQQFPQRAAREPASLAVPEISRTYVLQFSAANTGQIKGLLQRLQADSDVEFAERDQFVSTVTLPDDPFLSSTGTWGFSYPDLWGHYKVNAPTAWNTALGDNITVAVVDTGIDYNHPDIAANVIVLPGSDFIGSSCNTPATGNDPIDHFGHGTHVAGTIAAVGNNGIGIIGIAWHAKVLAVKGLDDNGCGLESTLAPSIQFAASNGADVINASWGGQGTSQTIEQAIQFATGLGAVFVAAAGNSAEDASLFFPANSPEAITVAASDPFNNFSFFSNFGSKIDVTGPGEDILSLQAKGTALGPPASPTIPGYIRLSGTSMATPHVAGTAALILSQNPAYTTDQVRAVLRASGTSATGSDWDPNFGYGIVNAQGALALPDALSVHITSPATGIFVNAPFTISGTAQGAGFDHYVLEYGSGLTPSTWTQLASGTIPVVASTLATLDPSTLLDGVYTIRLSGFDGANNVFRDRVQVTVRYIFVTDPPPPLVPVVASEFKPGKQVAISGTAAAPAFQGFSLQWAKGMSPTTGWSSTGITLAGGGTTQVSNGSLGTWDTTGIATADYYTLRLQVVDGSLTREARTLVYLEPSLLSVNWPQLLGSGPDFGSGFLPFSDASGSPRLGLVTPTYLVGNQSSQYVTFAPDGSSSNAITIAQASYLNPAVGNVDGVAGGDFVSPQASAIQFFHSDNTSFTFQKPSGFDFYNLVFGQALLADVEGNSQLDVIDTADLIDNTFGPTAAVFAWKPDGSMLNQNFPLIVPDENRSLTPRVMVGDIQGSGTKQFVVLEGTSTTQFTLGLFAHDGTPISWAVPVFTGQPVSMALADLDHNGALSTLLVMWDATQSQTILHVFQSDGSERPGWPVEVSHFSSLAYMAVGDLNRDGTEEIVVALQNVAVFVYEPDGTPFNGSWPTGFLAGPIALADIDGDGFPEILLSEYTFGFASNSLQPNLNGGLQPDQTAKIETTRTVQDGRVQYSAAVTPSSAGGINYLAPTLVALKNDGTVARSWTMLGAQGNQPYISPTITVGDFNGNGTTKIALTYFTILGGGESGFLVPGVALVLDTGSSFNANVNDWPMVNRDTLNSLVQQRSITVSITSPSAGQNVAGIVPVTAQTTGPVSQLQFKLDGSNLGSALTGPPFTIPWDTTKTTVGGHKLMALATDNTGRPVASATISVTVGAGRSSSIDLALTNGANPSTFGDSLTFTANVRPNIATGSVAFFDGPNAISGSVPLSGSTAVFSTSVLNASSHNVTARYSGDANFVASTSPVVTQNVNPATLVITASDATRSFGSPNPVFSGNVSGAVNGDTFTESFSTSASTSSPVGNYAIVPSVTGSDLANYTISPVNGTLTVNKAGSTANVATSNASVNVGTAVTFSATVTSATSGTPTGSVQFLDGTTVLGSSPLNAQGAAAMTTSSLSGGTHNITLQYGGDTNFSGSTSPALVENILDFSETASSSSAIIKAGGSASFTFTVTPLGGFNQTVSFSCSGLPAESQCAFNPPSLTPNGAPLTSTLTITTTAPSAALAPAPFGKHGLPLYASLSGGLLGIVWMTAGSRRRRRSAILLASLTLCTVALLASCGGGSSGPPIHHDPGTPLGTSQVTVTTTAGSTSHSAQVTITVTQ